MKTTIKNKGLKSLSIALALVVGGTFTSMAGIQGVTATQSVKAIALETVTGADAVSTSPTSITISWSPLGNGITNYDVYQATSLNGTYAYVRALTNGQTGCIITGLTKGKTYFYKVRANQIVNGKNIYSNQMYAFSAVTSATVGYTAPVQPTQSEVSTTLKSANFGVVVTTTSTVKDAVKYQIMDGTSKLTAVANLGTATTLFPTKAAGYKVSVVLFDANGNQLKTVQTALGQSGTTTPVVTLQTVTGTKTVAASSTSTITTWNRLSGVDGYDIYQATSLNGSYSFIATRANTVSLFQLNGLTKGKTYFYKVRANKVVNGKNIYSNTATFSEVTSASMTTPAQPTNESKISATIKAGTFASVGTVVITSAGLKAFPTATKYIMYDANGIISAIANLGSSTTVYPTKVEGDKASIKLLDVNNKVLTTIDVTLVR